MMIKIQIDGGSVEVREKYDWKFEGRFLSKDLVRSHFDTFRQADSDWKTAVFESVQLYNPEAEIVDEEGYSTPADALL